MKCHCKKGFTLTELLIVVVIVGILVAISVPIINKQLEKAREAHDIAVMRQAAAAAMHYYYMGINGADCEKTTKENVDGVEYYLKWWNNKPKEEQNAAGVYNPSNGKFYPTREDATSKGLKPYGKGTELDGETTFTMANERGAYASDKDYTKAVVMVSIFPYASQPYADIYWKSLKEGKYIGGPNSGNIANYSMRVNFN
ncbi:MAG: prepilin-type N-terminal cleavage/methylation domain-containing protein [Oribacterium sp.]|nr:prepilin-type N-terminal cleavage/methylation domain-containing protein [Oribacterium sp.]